MERFIIAGTQRTGTSLIVSTLDSHEDIHCLGEVFLFGKGRGVRISGSYRQYINADRWRRAVGHYLNRPAQVIDYLDDLYAGSVSKAVGFKFMLSQARQFPAAMNYIRERRVKVLHVVRNNALKTLVSRISARTRKLYHAKSDIAVGNVYISTRGLIRRLDSIQAEIGLWQKLAAGNPYEQIVYEEFVSDRDKELGKALKFIGVEYNARMSSKLRKINSNDLRQVVENYDEVARCLAGTAYEENL